MTVEISKGNVVQIEKDSSQPDGAAIFYFGTGWDVDANASSDTDVDLLVLPLKGGKAGGDLTSDLAFFQNQNGIPGISLGDDNRTGEGDGDDESVVIDTSKLDPSIDGIVIGLICWTGSDFASVKNPHIRGCDGGDENAAEVFDFPIQDSAFPDDTVLVAARLQKTSGGWALKAEGVFHALGQEGKGLNAFYDMFK